MLAFSASRLVCAEISLMTVVISSMAPAASPSSWTRSAAAVASATASAANVRARAERRAMALMVAVICSVAPATLVTAPDACRMDAATAVRPPLICSVAAATPSTRCEVSSLPAAMLPAIASRSCDDCVRAPAPSVTSVSRCCRLPLIRFRDSASAPTSSCRCSASVRVRSPSASCRANSTLLPRGRVIDRTVSAIETAASIAISRAATNATVVTPASARSSVSTYTPVPMIQPHGANCLTYDSLRTGSLPPGFGQR